MIHVDKTSMSMDIRPTKTQSTYRLHQKFVSTLGLVGRAKGPQSTCILGVDLARSSLILLASSLGLVDWRWTRHTLENMAPKASVKPQQRSHTRIWHTNGKCATDTVSPSIPNKTTLLSSKMMPTSITLLQAG